jgi:prolycopene isomerase
MLTMLVFALSIATCAQDDADENTGSSLTADALTSATPGIAQFVLSDKHAGWGQRECLSCHDTLHTSGFSVPQCAHCHGTNGAPVRKALASGADHPDGNCQSCHADQHPSEGFTPPNDCRGCHRFEKVAQGCTHTEDYDVVVVGGGGGGLSAASVLARAGKSVLVIEQSYKVGGAMVNFHRGDFRFEASLHAMDGMGLQYLNLLGIADKVQVVEGDFMFHVATSDLNFEVPADVVEYQDKLMNQFPEHADNIAQLFTDMAGAMESMDFSKFEGKSTVEALAEYNITTQDKSLFNIVTSLVGFVAGGLDVIPASMYVGMWYTMHHMNYAYFVGGSQSITDALAEVIEEAGGVIKTHALATKIVIDGGKATQVRTDEGGCYNAAIVISNVNEPSTYLGLIGEQHLPAELVTKLKTKKPAPTISTVFIATNKDFTSYFPGGGHEIFVFGDGVGTSEHQQSVYCKLDDQGVAITNYSVLDPTAAPAGKNVITISNAIGYDCNDQWKFGDSWESYNAFKWEIAQKTIEKAEVYLPGLSEHIDVLEVGSPQTIEAYTKNPKGSWSGWETEPNMADPLGIVAPEKHLSPFPNLFLTGAWVTLGGQSVVLMSGKAAADLVLEEFAQN